jgi:hypothetical protein
VAWQESFEEGGRPPRFVVRTLDEELSLARANGWSSDIKDVWTGRRMEEWAAMASAKFLDPCIRGQEDPRTWANR